VRTFTPLRLPLFLFLVLCLIPPARALELTTSLEEYMDACVRVRHFSGAVLVSRDGLVLFSKGYGLANAEHQVANTPETRFRLGSITKQFTAMANLILQERGKLVVEDPIGKFGAYVGRYELGPDWVMTITREGDRLFAQPTGQAKREFLPESETAFFSEVPDAQITFVKDEKGRVTHLVIHLGGQEMRAKRLSAST
jgi:hypothetical protein